MSNRILNQSAVPVSTITMRAKEPVFSTEDQFHENRVGGISEQSIYPTYPTTFKAYVPSAEHTLHPIESIAHSQSISAHGNDRLMNARQAAAKLGVSERWVRDHTTRRSPRNRGLKLASLVRCRWADVK